MNTKKNYAEKDAVLMQHPDYQQELVQIIRSNISPKALMEQVREYHENDIASVLELLNKKEREHLYHILDTETLSNILEYTEDISPYLNELSLRKKVNILSCIEADKAADYLKKLDKSERNTLIELMDESVKQDIALFQSFDEDEIGNIMTTNYIEIVSDISVREAMRELIEQAAENDNVSTIYVVDENRIFYGAIDLKDLIIARESSDLKSLIMTAYPYVYAHEQIEDCVARIKDYSEDSIPVLDNGNRLLGVITAQDFMQVVDDELGDDYAKLAGLTAEEDLKESVMESTRKRLPWLIMLLALGMGVSSVVGLFESVVAELTIIVCFQSLILDMAGNVGTQSLAVTIRVLMDENLSGKQKLSLIIKESKVGLTNGAILGILSFIAIGLYTCLLKGKSFGFSFAVSACTGIALLISMVLAAFAGSIIPIFFKKIKIDPAVASGPLITTINDLVAVITYYGLAWIFLIQTLHLAG